MLKVMLVDDEYIILSGMEALLKAQCDVIISVSSFLDSGKAVEMIPTLQPDVVITDINMPELDGLTLIERALNQGFTGRFLIISGYEEIDYFKRAISFHVIDYLVKPIDKNKLYQLLKQMDEDKHQSTQAMLYRLLPFLTRSRQSTDVNRSLSDCEMRMLLPEAYVMLLAVQGCNPDTYSKWTDKLTSHFQHAYLLPHKSYGIFLCNFSESICDEEIICILKDYAGLSCMTFGVSTKQPTSRFLFDINQEGGSMLLLMAVTHMAMQFLFLEPDLIKACRPSSMNYQFGDTVFRPHNTEELEKACDSLMAGSQNNVEPFTKAFLEIFSIASVQHNLILGSEAARELYERKREEIVDKQSLRFVLKTLQKYYLQSMGEKCNEAIRYSGKVEMALLYMKRHYNENISLYTVAEHVGLNASYLSALFSKEVGETFLNHLHKLRMEAACMLLENDPSISTEDISSRVGYLTVGHFYKTFKTRYGVSPNKWRSSKK